jgi:hypothetical protein
VRGSDGLGYLRGGLVTDGNATVNNLATNGSITVYNAGITTSASAWGADDNKITIRSTPLLTDGSPNELVLGVATSSRYWGVAYIDTAKGGVAAVTPLSFRVNGSEKVRIIESGNVGIGTTAPTEKLEVSGNLKVTGTINGVTAAQFSQLASGGGGGVTKFILARVDGTMNLSELESTDAYGNTITDLNNRIFYKINIRDVPEIIFGESGTVRVKIIYFDYLLISNSAVNTYPSRLMLFGTTSSNGVYKVQIYQLSSYVEYYNSTTFSGDIWQNTTFVGRHTTMDDLYFYSSGASLPKFTSGLEYGTGLKHRIFSYEK